MTARDNRLFVEAVLYRYRTGMAWRDLPERFGDFRVVHLRHSRKRNGELVGAGLARDSLHVPTLIAGWSREFVRPAARLRNGLRLQANRCPAQMRPAKEARSYKKYRSEITIDFARFSGSEDRAVVF